MGVVRSHVFIAFTTAPGTGVVPAGKLWLVKYALINNPTASTQTWSIVATVSGVARTLFSGSIAAQATAILPQPFTLAAGDTLRVSGASASLVVGASGIEFTP